MATPQSEPSPDPAVCPRCQSNPLAAGRTICDPCADEERGEELAGEEDRRTAIDAKREAAQGKPPVQQELGAAPQGKPAQQRNGSQQRPAQQRPQQQGRQAPGRAEPPRQAAPAPGPAPSPPGGPPRDMPAPASRPSGAPSAGGRRMALDAVRAKPAEAKHKVVLYGPEGTGKTTFGMEAPAPIFIPTENSSIIERSSIPRFPQPQAWAELLEAVDVLINDPHEFKTLVIDTLDRAEELAQAQAVINWNGSKPKQMARNIEDVGGGFMKGYVAALDLMRVLLSRLERLIERRQMHVVLIAHGTIRKIKDPSVADDFDQWDVALYDGRNASASDLFRNWADTVLFVNFETNIKFDFRGRAKRRAESPLEGSRLLFTQRAAGWRAKNRDGLPLKMPFSWAHYEWAVTKCADPAYLVEIIREKVAEIGDAAIGEWVEAELAKNPPAQRLVQINLKLAARLEQVVEQAAPAEPSKEA